METIKNLKRLIRDSFRKKGEWVSQLNKKSFTQHWMTRVEYLKKHPSAWEPLYKTSKHNWKAPKFYDRSYGVDLRRCFSPGLPEFGLLKVEQGKVFGKDGWILGADNCLLPESSRFGTRVGEIKMPRAEPKFKQVSGSCLSITSTYSGNYFHFLIDSLPRLHLFFEAGYSFSDIDNIYLPSPESEHSKVVLDQLEIPKSKIIWADDGEGVIADKLIATSYPGQFQNYPNWVSTFYKDRFESNSKVVNRRLYINRQGLTRNLANADQLADILDKYGFENYSPGDHLEQWKDFQEAEIILAPHGAALSNMVFCRPGTKILEVIPSDQVRIYFYSLARACDLQYGYLIGESVAHRAKDSGPSPYDFNVRPEQLDKALKMMLG